MMVFFSDFLFRFSLVLLHDGFVLDRWTTAWSTKLSSIFYISVFSYHCFYEGLEFIFNKKYVLWNAGICPIAETVRNITFDDHIKSHNRY